MAFLKRSRSSEDRSKAPGDVLGISRASGEIPHDHVRSGGHPEGIEVGVADRNAIRQKTGATSIDMGAGGEGHAIKR